MKYLQQINIEIDSSESLCTRDFLKVRNMAIGEVQSLIVNGCIAGMFEISLTDPRIVSVISWKLFDQNLKTEAADKANKLLASIVENVKDLQQKYGVSTLKEIEEYRDLVQTANNFFEALDEIKRTV